MTSPPARPPFAMGPHPTVFALLAGLTLLVAVPVAVALGGAGEFGEAPSGQRQPTEPQPTEPASPAATGERPQAGRTSTTGRIDDAEQAAGGPRAPAGPAASSAVTVRSARVEDLPPVAAPPAEVRLPRLGIAAEIDAVTAPGGVLAVPDDVTRAGWYEPGSTPGDDQGSAVLSSHVDSRTRGKGAFFTLTEAAEGDRVEVDTHDGSTLVYEVTALARYYKDELPVADLFRSDGDPQLVLVTCGGSFDQATRTYAENVVVIAEPADH